MNDDSFVERDSFHGATRSLLSHTSNGIAFDLFDGLMVDGAARPLRTMFGFGGSAGCFGLVWLHETKNGGSTIRYRYRKLLFELSASFDLELAKSSHPLRLFALEWDHPT